MLVYSEEGDNDNLRGKIVEHCTIAPIISVLSLICAYMLKFTKGKKADEKFPTVESVLQPAVHYFQY